MRKVIATGLFVLAATVTCLSVLGSAPPGAVAPKKAMGAKCSDCFCTNGKVCTPICRCAADSK